MVVHARSAVRIHRVRAGAVLAGIALCCVLATAAGFVRFAWIATSYGWVKAAFLKDRQENARLTAKMEMLAAYLTRETKSSVNWLHSKTPSGWSLA